MYRFILISIIFFTVVLGFGCKKETTDIPIIPEKYSPIGKYKVNEDILQYGPFGFHTNRDTFISITPGTNDTLFYLLGRQIHIDHKGNYTANYYECRLWSDSLYSYEMSGGMGSTRFTKYVGIRISKTF
jgi:hypothetical protein